MTRSSSLLASAGLDVIVFASATDFLTADKPDAPACLVLDLQLPDIHGLDLQRELIEREAPPIVFITGHGDVPSSVKAMKAGAVEFLPKPFGEEELLRAIDAAVDAGSSGPAEAIGARRADQPLRATDASRTRGAHLRCRWLCQQADRWRTRDQRDHDWRPPWPDHAQDGARSLAELVRFADKLGIRPHESH